MSLRIIKVSFVLSFFLTSIIFHAKAATLEVSDTNSSEVRKLELKEGQSADMLVYLQSYGDMVDKYLVTLRRESDNKRMAALLSDDYGRVLFKNLAADRYRVEVSRRIREDGRLSTVSIGDVVLSPSIGFSHKQEGKVPK